MANTRGVIIAKRLYLSRERFPGKSAAQVLGSAHLKRWQDSRATSFENLAQSALENFRKNGPGLEAQRAEVFTLRNINRGLAFEFQASHGKIRLASIEKTNVKLPGFGPVNSIKVIFHPGSTPASRVVVRCVVTTPAPEFEGSPLLRKGCCYTVGKGHVLTADTAYRLVEASFPRAISFTTPAQAQAYAGVAAPNLTFATLAAVIQG